MSVDVHSDEVQAFAEIADVKFDAAFAAVVVLCCKLAAKHIVDVDGNVLAVFNRAEVDVYNTAGWVGVDAYAVVGSIVLDVDNAGYRTNCR